MTVYATPATEADFTSLIDGIEWSTDPNDNTANAQDLLDRIRAIYLGWQYLQPVNLLVVQDTPPSLNDWQTAWKDTGRSLPITGNVRGTFVTASSINRYMAEYIFDNGEMLPMQSRWWQGSVEVTQSLANQITPANLTSSESIVYTPVIRMRKAGWTSLVMLMGTTATTLPLVRWRTSRESTNYTYGIISAPTTTASTNLEVYHGPTRDNSPLNGTLDLYETREAGSDAAVVGYAQVNYGLDAVPGYMRHVYD